MSDEYKYNEETFADEEEFTEDEVLVEKFRQALKYRLDAATDATAAANNYREVAKSLEDIAQDEALVATLDDEARRHIDRADKLRTAAREEFYIKLAQLKSAPGPVAHGERFAIQVAVREKTRAMLKVDAADACLAKATEDKDKADAELAIWQAAHAGAMDIPANRKTQHSTPFSSLPQALQDRIAADALAQYKEALSQHRSDLAKAKLTYVSRLQSLRTLQTTHLQYALDALTTAKALPDPNAATYGTKVVLRSVG